MYWCTIIFIIDVAESMGPGTSTQSPKATQQGKHKASHHTSCGALNFVAIL